MSARNLGRRMLADEMKLNHRLDQRIAAAFDGADPRATTVYYNGEIIGTIDERLADMPPYIPTEVWRGAIRPLDTLEQIAERIADKRDPRLDDRGNVTIRPLSIDERDAMKWRRPTA